MLVRHFRHSTRRWHLEVPRGFGTPRSSPEDDARRELKEEIDAEPAKPLESLGVVYPDTGQMATPSASIMRRSRTTVRLIGRKG